MLTNRESELVLWNMGKRRHVLRTSKFQEPCCCCYSFFGMLPKDGRSGEGSAWQVSAIYMPSTAYRPSVVVEICVMFDQGFNRLESFKVY